jgi:hypothetical protein
MAICTFSLDKYQILHTRAVHEDTNYVTAKLTVDNQLIGEPQVKFMGNQNNGTFNVGFTWPDVNVPPDGKVELFYQILNSGHTNHATMEKALATATAVTSGNWIGELAKLAVPFLVANCDGPIGPPEGRTIEFGGPDLNFLAGGTDKTFRDKHDEPGNDSPHGCGSNSHYVVHYSVTAR